MILGKPVDEFVYRYVPGLWVITPYYNPMGYQTRRRNYEIFSRVLRNSGIPLITVECVFGDQKFDLPESPDVIRLKSESMLWQKERLLNLAISWLPPSCTAVAWLDCDLMFTNPNWAQETVARLHDAAVVQVFETCNRLPQQYADPSAHGDICTSFGSVLSQDPSQYATGNFANHGHTGYGWAARRDILDKHGLYEAAIAGSADHYMAHAAVGDFDSVCITRHMSRNPTLKRHYRDWAESFYESVGGKLQAVSGTVLHLWHGELADRKYSLRHLELEALQFNPYTDLVSHPGKPLELKPSSRTEELIRWFGMYFASRREDGPLTATI